MPVNLPEMYPCDSPCDSLSHQHTLVMISTESCLASAVPTGWNRTDSLLMCPRSRDTIYLAHRRRVRDPGITRSHEGLSGRKETRSSACLFPIHIIVKFRSGRIKPYGRIESIRQWQHVLVPKLWPICIQGGKERVYSPRICWTR